MVTDGAAPSNRWGVDFEAAAPWAGPGEIRELKEDLPRLIRQFNEVLDSLSKPRRVFMATYCLSSSRLEGTLPNHVSDQRTFLGLIEGDMASREGVAWEQDGETEDEDEAVAQMFSHMRALDFVLESAAQRDHVVTVDWIREVHSRLMDGAHSFEDGFRRKNEHVTAGGLGPPTPSNMAAAVDNVIVSPLLEAMADSSLNPLVVGCDVLCRTIALHPFRNGNGRLARLMFVYTMARFGVSVPVVFSSCRKHYIQALKYSDPSHAGQAEMAQIDRFVLSLHQAKQRDPECRPRERSRFVGNSDTIPCFALIGSPLPAAGGGGRITLRARPVPPAEGMKGSSTRAVGQVGRVPVAVMIKFFLLVNKQGQTRLASYYDFLPLEERNALQAETIRRCLSRSPTECSILEYRGYRIVYRRYASLFFIVGIDRSDENELATLELIHAYVEALDKHFENVIMFNLEKAHMILDEMIMNGCVTETNKRNILQPVIMLEKVSND